MPRQVRIPFPGAVYHGMARGDRREAIFLDDEDRTMFLKAPAEANLLAEIGLRPKIEPTIMGSSLRQCDYRPNQFRTPDPFYVSVFSLSFNSGLYLTGLPIHRCFARLILVLAACLVG